MASIFSVDKSDPNSSRTFTGGELDEFRFFFMDENSDIISEYIKHKDPLYPFDIEYLHPYYSQCLDKDPANGVYLYNMINSYFLRRKYKESLLLGEKYLMLNDSDRMYLKHKVLIIMIKILANVYEKYDDAMTYAGDMLGIIEHDFAKLKYEKGFAYFFKDIQDRVAADIYIA